MTAREPERKVSIPDVDPDNPRQIGNMDYERASRLTLSARGEVTRGAELFESQSCIACHTTADGQVPKGPHLLEIGKRSPKK